MYWEDLTWPELDRTSRTTPVVLNLASIEQHGPHLPLSTDSAIGGFFMQKLDEALGSSVLVLPQVKVCCSAHHMDFPGTLTVRHETLLAYVCDMLESMVAHGFRNIVLVNSHGGNQAIGQVILEKFGAAHPDCRIVFLTWWRMAAAELERIRESGFGGVGHACEFETAIMMHAVPDTVRTALIAGQNYVPTFPWADSEMLISGRASLFRTIRAMSNGTGVLGDASLASSDKGRRITEAVMQQLIAIIRSLHEAS
ncbi:creatininase family protein [Roseomonas gilardii]|uniref:Creatinine amidohydrolase n=1 Tax=Roseomonas gilardii TaxID=257708 RepID=A0A1L7AN62_9PROT|nr:creatininase family protein [Roseomonas gilardii]APT60220.1 creatinine amidohydrolase [Roseomonas gilardii]